LDKNNTIFLPNPVAIAYTKLIHPNVGDAEFTRTLTIFLNEFTRILSSVFLSILYFYSNDEIKFKTNLNVILPDRKNQFLTMGTGMNAVKRIIDFLRINNPEALTGPYSVFTDFFLKNDAELFHLTADRAKTKNFNFADLRNLVDSISILVKKFSDYKIKFYAVTKLNFIDSGKNRFQVELIDWNDIEQIDLKVPLHHYREEPMMTSYKGLFFKSKDSEKYSFLPEFLIYDRIEASKKNHFIVADSITTYNSISIKLKPFSNEPLENAELLWPIYKKQR
jgi:hypothetical protein